MINLLFLLLQISSVPPTPGVLVLEEGAQQCKAISVDFVGSSITAACVGPLATVTLTGGGGGAPTDAEYWVGAGHAGLSAEKDLSGFTGLVLNTIGTPSSKGTNSCTNQFPRSDNASGVWACASIADADVPNNITIDAAAALTADPANCGVATEFAVGINASGVATCEAIADADVPNTITIDQATLALTGDSATAFFSAGTLEVARGGTNLTASADDNVMVGNATTWESKAVPDCDTAATSKLLYDTATNTFSCGTDQTSAGGVTTLTSTTNQSDAVIATYTAITGLSFTPAANTNYYIDCFIIYTSTAATTGINFAWDVPAAVTSIHMTGYTTTTALGANEGFIQRADNVGTPTSASIVTTEQVAYLQARLRNGVNATTTSLGFTPETANSVSVIAGSTCQYRTY